MLWDDLFISGCKFKINMEENKMQNRTLKADLKVRTKEKEKELFYEICRKNKTTGQAVLREYILKYIEVNMDRDGK